MIIVIEGADKVGKTTICNNIEKRCMEMDIDIHVLKCPTRRWLSEEVINYYLKGKSADSLHRQFYFIVDLFMTIYEGMASHGFDIGSKSDTIVFDRHPLISFLVYHGLIDQGSLVFFKMACAAWNFFAMQMPMHVFVIDRDKPWIDIDESEFFEFNWNRVRARYKIIEHTNLESLNLGSFHLLPNNSSEAVAELITRKIFAVEDYL